MEGGRVCSYCRRYFDAPKTCDRCGGLTRHIRLMYANGARTKVCTVCINATTCETCSVCRKYRIPANRTTDGRPLCGHCATGLPFVCTVCRREGIRHSAGVCRVCYLMGVIRGRQEELRHELNSEWVRDLYDRFFSDWLKTHHLQGGWRSTMRRHLAFFQRLSREFSCAEHMRQEGLLPRFDTETLRRANVPFRWLVAAAGVPSLSPQEAETAAEQLAQANILARSVGWKLKLLERFHSTLLRRKVQYRKRGWTGESVKFKDRTVTVALRAAFKLLESVPGDVGSPQAITQSTVDQFLARSPGQRDAVGAFVTHLNTQEKLFKAIQLSKSVKQDVPYHLLLTWERSEELLKTWFSPEYPDSRKALIGVLLLLYARSAYQACHLRRADFSLMRRGGVIARFGAVPVRLDDRTAALVRAQIQTVESGRGKTLNDEEFIFPGRSPGRPLTPAAVDYMLKRDSLKSSQLYSTGLVAWYEQDLQFPKVLSKILGITVQTAMKYWKAFSPRIVQELQQRVATR